MKYALYVTASPDSASNITAYEFARAALESGHTIETVLFFQDGVYTAFSDFDLPHGERDANRLWRELNQAYGVSLSCCITSGRRRGLTEERLATPFYFSGLGAFMGLLTEVDRVVQFS